MVLPHRACGYAAGAAPIPVCGWDLIKWLKPGDAGRGEDKGATGRSPVSQAALALELPGFGHPLEFPQGLEPFPLFGEALAERTRVRFGAISLQRRALPILDQ